MELIWEHKQAQYATGSDLLVNGTVVASTYWNMQSRDTPQAEKEAHQWAGSLALPAPQGRVYKTIYAPTEEDVKKKLGEQFERWLKRIQE